MKSTLAPDKICSDNGDLPTSLILAPTQLRDHLSLEVFFLILFDFLLNLFLNEV